MDSESTQRLIRQGLIKGCLGGVALTLVFFIISVINYAVLSRSGLQFLLVLFISVLSGPVIGTSVLLILLYNRSVGTARSKLGASVPDASQDDETGPG